MQAKKSGWYSLNPLKILVSLELNLLIPSSKSFDCLNFVNFGSVIPKHVLVVESKLVYFSSRHIISKIKYKKFVNC